MSNKSHDSDVAFIRALAELLNENGMPRNRRELQPEKLAALPQRW